MDKNAMQLVHDVEERFWWFRGMRAIRMAWLATYLPRRKLKLLDVGCGPGGFTQRLKRFGTVHGIDVSPHAVAFCRSRGLKNIKQGTAERLPYAANSFDVVTCNDVIYHREVKDDVLALKEMHHVLKPNGIILVSDIAFPILRGPHDRAFGGRQRYTKRELREKLKKAGFQPLRCTYCNTFLFPPIAAVRLFQRFLYPGKAIPNRQQPLFFFNDAFLFLLRIEAFLLRYVNFPFGLTVMCVARKPDGSKHKA